MEFTWQDVQEFKEKASLTDREIAALRRRLGLPRDPNGAYLTVSLPLRTRLVLKARSKLLQAMQQEK